MAATKDWEAVLYLLKNTVGITTLLDTYAGTAEPLVAFGNIPESETGDNAIAFQLLEKDNTHKVGNTFFSVNCYAANQYESMDIADQVYNLFDDAIGEADGFPLKTYAMKINRSITDSTRLSYNTPVTIRVQHIGD